MRELPQALCVATLKDRPRLDQGPQQAQAPLDQCDLGIGECQFSLAPQDLFQTREGALHLGGHAGIQRFVAQIDGVHEAQSSTESQAYVRTQDRVWQGEDPDVDGPCFTAEPQGMCSQLHQGGGKGVVRRSERVCNRLPQLARRLIKTGSPDVQQRDQFGLAGVQTSAQGLAKEIMKAIPLSLLIERHHKEVRSIQFLQHLLAGGLIRHCGDHLA